MKSSLLRSLSLFTALCLSAVGVLHASVENGAPAPAFSLPDASGQSVSLADFKGKYVVLEWVNPGCPFVKKFYEPGAMQRFQSQAQELGAVWLAVNSTEPGHRDYLDAAATAAFLKANKVAATAWLLDPQGTVGQAYGARTTPHLFLISPEGKVVYQGAIDSVKSTDSADIAGATNHILKALEAALAGKPIDPAQTRPYGCSVKYAQ